MCEGLFVLTCVTTSSEICGPAPEWRAPLVGCRSGLLGLRQLDGKDVSQSLHCAPVNPVSVVCTAMQMRKGARHASGSASD